MEKINLQGNLVDKNTIRINPIDPLWLNNGVMTESLRVFGGKIIFLEDHYFKLMAKLRIARIQIPAQLRPEYFYSQLQKTLEANPMEEGLLHFHCGLLQDKLEYIISTENQLPQLQETYDLGNYTDFYIEENPLESLGFGQGYKRMFEVYSQENQWDDVLIFRKNKSVVRSKNGALFIVLNDMIRTTVVDEPFRSVWQSNFLEFLSTQSDLPIETASTIFPYEVSQAQTVFIWRDFVGMQAVSHYKNKAVKSNDAVAPWQIDWTNYLSLVAEKDPLQHI